MKKILVLIICVYALICITKQADASVEPYDNMIDMSMVEYDVETGFFCSRQKIELKAGTTYTVVASKEFFGERIVNWNDLKDKFFTVAYETNNGNNLVLPFAFKVSLHLGLHYTTVTPSYDCKMIIKNFLTKGYTLETFKRDEVIMFKGSMSDFKGFKKYVDLDGSEKVDGALNIHTDINNMISMDTITDSIVAYDSQDGIVNEVDIIKNEYENVTKPGMYQIIYQAKDNAQNKKNLVVNVNVEDNTPPEIIGDDTIMWELGNPCPTDAEIVSKFKVTDNVDGDISYKLKISSSALYSYSLTAEGEYLIVIDVKDTSGNVGSRNVFLKVEDNTPPDVVVQDVSVKLSESFTSKLDNLAARILIKATDASQVTNNKYDYKEYVDNIGFSGKYLITVEVTDLYDNSTVKQAYLTIVDDIAPEFYVKKDLFTTNTSKSYSIDEVKREIGRKLKSDGILYDNVQMISSDYFENKNTPGEYEVKFMYEYDGHINYMVGRIVVEEANKPNYNYLWYAIAAVALTVIVITIYRKRKSVI